MSSTIDNQSAADCLTALDVIAHPYGQYVRIGFIALLLLQFLLFLIVAFEYKRKGVVLHGNLKFLYANLAILYQLAPFGHLLAEGRHLILTIFFQSSPCSMLTPLWYVFLSRGTISIYNFSIPLFHFAIMLERLRATQLVNRYEFEGLHFGVCLALIVYAPVLVVTAITCFMVFVDADYQFDKMLAVNSLTTKSSNLPVQIFTYFLISIVVLTALGDILIYRKNQMMRREKLIVRQSKMAPYNLSEKYQLAENGRAMRLILPLDIAYMASYLAYSILVVIIRSYQPPKLPYSMYLANYNILACILTVYTIVSLVFYRRFLLQNVPGNNQNTAEVVPLEMMGSVYFDQLRTQWK